MIDAAAEVEQFVDAPHRWNDRAGAIAVVGGLGQRLLDQPAGHIGVVRSLTAQNAPSQHSLPGSSGCEVER